MPIATPAAAPAAAPISAPDKAPAGKGPAPVAAPATPPAPAGPSAAEKAKAWTGAISTLEKNRQADAKLKADRAALDADRAKLAEDAKAASEWKAALAKAKADPMAALKALGLEYNDIAATHLQQGKPPLDLQFKDLEEKFNRDLAERTRREEQAAEDAKKAEKARAEGEQKTRAERIQQAKAEVAAEVQADAAAYPVIASLGAGAQVADLMMQAHAEGKALSQEDAAKQVEAQLAANVSQLVEKAPPPLRALIEAALAKGAPEKPAVPARKPASRSIAEVVPVALPAAKVDGARPTIRPPVRRGMSAFEKFLEERPAKTG